MIYARKKRGNIIFINKMEGRNLEVSFFCCIFAQNLETGIKTDREL